MGWIDAELALTAVAAMLSPTTLSFSVLALVLGDRPLRTGVWFYLGALGATLAVGVLAAFVLGNKAASTILYYQPVVDLTGRLEKVEALVRWSHPSGRVVLPAEFVPLAEASGLIVQLGDMVLHMACDKVNRWRRQYPALAELGVAVNISSAQLRSEDAVHNMASIIEKTG